MTSNIYNPLLLRVVRLVKLPIGCYVHALHLQYTFKILVLGVHGTLFEKRVFELNDLWGATQ